MKKVEEVPYLYVERSCSMDPADISRNMGMAFGTVAEFIGRKGIASMGNALSVYYSHGEETMTFRGGFIVSAQDAEAGEGEVHGDVLPAGDVLNFVHRGPYATLRDSYAEMLAYLEANSLVIDAPTVEIYLNSPDTVDSEDELETDIYVAVSPA
jgi:effector-binding domain-containing protein